MTDPLSRRRFLGAGGAGLALAGAAMVSGRAQAASLREAPTMTDAKMQPPLSPKVGPDYQPVVTLNGWTLPWRMNDGVKEFHLVAEPVVREIAPGMKAQPVGLQRPDARARRSRRSRATACASSSPTSCPSPPASTGTASCLPNGMDGVAGLTQPRHRARQDLRLRVLAAAARHVHVPPARRRDGADGDGHDGLLRRRTRSDPHAATRSTATSCFLLNAYDIEPGSYTPKVNDDARLQPVDLQQPRLPGHRPAGGAPGRPGAHPHRQPDDDQPPDPHARPRVRGDRHRRRLGARRRRAGRR